MSSEQIEKGEAMAGQAGRDVVVRVGDGGSPESFDVVAGIRSRSIRLGARVVDATHADSAGAWRELKAGAGVKSVSVSGAGAFSDAASDARMRTAFFAGQAANMELEVAAFGVLSGPFVVAELIYGGAHDAEATFSVRLESAGAVTFAAA